MLKNPVKSPISPERVQKRNEILRRRSLVSSLYMRRLIPREIAEVLGKMEPPIVVAAMTVWKDIQAIQAEWLKERLANQGIVVARELAELNAMERDCAAQFVQKHEPVWIVQRLKIKERRARLLGLDAPTKIDLAVYAKEQALALGLDEKYAVEIAEEVVRSHAARAEPR